MADFEVFMEKYGVIRSDREMCCHNVTVVNDDRVESPEELQASLVMEYNVASVILSPDIATITIDDDDSK